MKNKDLNREIACLFHLEKNINEVRLNKRWLKIYGSLYIFLFILITVIVLTLDIFKQNNQFITIIILTSIISLILMIPWNHLLNTLSNYPVFMNKEDFNQYIKHVEEIDSLVKKASLEFKPNILIDSFEYSEITEENMSGQLVTYKDSYKVSFRVNKQEFNDFMGTLLIKYQENILLNIIQDLKNVDVSRAFIEEISKSEEGSNFIYNMSVILVESEDF